MTIKVRGGTPHHGGPGLCHSCKYSHIYRAAAESEVVVICKAGEFSHGPLMIRKPVVECSDYANKLEKSEYEMNKIAWVLLSKGGKPIGFFSPQETKRKVKDKDVDDPGLDD